jgi:hypothetical protein
MRPFYSPSGKYRPHAPAILFGAVFLVSAFTAIIYGWTISEFSVSPHVNVTYAFCEIVVALYLNGRAASYLIKKLQIRNPPLTRRVVTLSAALGWQFNWLALYVVYTIFTGDERGFFHFIDARLAEGVPAAVTWGSIAYATDFYFHGVWYLLLPAWLIEATLLPYWLSAIAAVQAGYPFSEATLTWHRFLLLKERITYPGKKRMLESLRRDDSDILLTMDPAKHEKGRYGEAGWDAPSLFFPTQKGDPVYVSISGANLPGPYVRAEILRRFWVVSEAEAETLARRFAGNEKESVKVMITFNKLIEGDKNA